MTIYHPRSWLRNMPKYPRFYASVSDLQVEHPGIAASEIVTATYSGPVDETTIVFTPRAPRAEGVSPLAERAPVHTTDATEVPVSDQAQATAATKAPKKTSKKKEVL